MTVFYDVEKAVLDFRVSMSGVANKVTDPEMSAQLRSVDVQAEFVRWSLTEMNLGTDQDDLVHATAAILANMIINIISNTDDEHGSTLIPRLFNMLQNDTGETVSEVHVGNMIGGRA
ncbi:hypothetical protein ACJKIH_03150 [Brucella pseudogrignonensis]|uniref:hypothetical protein n=1 Tax=Brucella pseudogrignonensis TaxID=419475 RepID=UPI0038B592AD